MSSNNANLSNTGSTVDLDAIKEIVGLMKDSDLREFEIEQDKLKLRIKRGPDGALQTVVAPAALPAAPTAAPAAEAAPAAATPTTDDGKVIKSPMVGTFYTAPSPESPPFVKPGDKFAADTVICIVEAMKVMNEIQAEQTGEIVEVLVENGTAVEFGQPLFKIK